MEIKNRKTYLAEARAGVFWRSFTGRQEAKAAVELGFEINCFGSK